MIYKIRSIENSMGDIPKCLYKSNLLSCFNFFYLYFQIHNGEPNKCVTQHHRMKTNINQGQS